MAKQIHYQRRTSFLGRNGTFKQDGILVSQFDGEISLVPITSKNLIGRARLSVPNTAIPELIQTLQTMLKL
jgi:hypothetical protein